MDFFNQYYWEGNVRELKNVIEYACTIKTKGDITMNDIPDYMFQKKKIVSIPSERKHSKSSDSADAAREYLHPGASLSSQVEALEKDILQGAFKRNRYSITKTAKELSIARQTLYNKLAKYGLL